MENERGPQAGSFGPGLDQYLANGGKIIISVKNGFLNYELEKDGNYSTAKTDGND